MSGIILAVCTSTNGGIPKYPQPVASVSDWGFDGDYHNRPERRSYRRKIMVPNVDRHLLLVDQEAKADITDVVRNIFRGKEAFLEFGSLSENILTRGLGDVSQFIDRRLFINDGEVVLRVIEPADPCKHVRARYGLDVYTALMNRRGMYCAIVTGKGRQISPGDSIKIT